MPPAAISVALEAVCAKRELRSLVRNSKRLPNFGRSTRWLAPKQADLALTANACSSTAGIGRWHQPYLAPPGALTCQVLLAVQRDAFGAVDLVVLTEAG